MGGQSGAPAPAPQMGSLQGAPQGGIFGMIQGVSGGQPNPWRPPAGGVPPQGGMMGGPAQAQLLANGFQNQGTPLPQSDPATPSAAPVAGTPAPPAPAASRPIPMNRMASSLRGRMGRMF